MKKNQLAILLLLIAAIFFSLGGLLIKIIPWNPLAINGSRNLIACIVVGCYLIITKHSLRINGTILLGAFAMCGVTTLFTMANKMTTAGNTIVLQYTAPIWIVIFLWGFFHKKPKKREVFTIFVVFIGILCFFLDSISSGHLAGDMIALFSGIFYALVFMLNEFEKGDAILSVFFGQLLSAIFFTPLVMSENVFTAKIFLAVFVLGSVQVGISYICFSVGTKYTDPVTASIIVSIEPILNPILVAIFYGEYLGKMSLIGAAIVMVAMILYNISKSKSENELCE